MNESQGQPTSADVAKQRTLLVKVTEFLEHNDGILVAAQKRIDTPPVAAMVGQPATQRELACACAMVQVGIFKLIEENCKIHGWDATEVRETMLMLAAAKVQSLKESSVFIHRVL